MTDVWKAKWRRIALIAAGMGLALAAGLLWGAGIIRRASSGKQSNGIADPITQAQANIAATRQSLKGLSDQALADLFNKNIKEKL